MTNHIWDGFWLLANARAFRALLTAFYAEWKAKFGDEAWRTLEGVVGPLS